MKGEYSSQLDHFVPPAIAFFERDLRPGGLAHWRAKRALAYIEAHLGTKIEKRRGRGLRRLEQESLLARIQAVDGALAHGIRLGATHRARQAR